MTTINTTNKKRVHDFSRAVHDVSTATVDDLLAEYYGDDAVWNGFGPIGTVEGRDALAAEFWRPLLEAFPDLQQNDHIIFGNDFEGADWVLSTGYLLGTFENDWLGIPATGHATWLHYAAFHEFEGGDIVRTKYFLDVLDVMRQAGYEFFPAPGPQIVAPGPTTQNGVQLTEQDPDESAKTLQLVEDMIFEGLHSYEEEGLDGLGMEKYWHEDFMYYAPCGIGTTRGIDGFQAYHQAPFLEAFPDRRGGNHEPRIAEGYYCASTGPVSATHTGSGWLSLPATGREVAIDVVDVWRREGDRLAQNWLFIDLVDFLDQIGVDIFERLKEHPRSVRASSP
jgi:predicted ester cyclase